MTALDQAFIRAYKQDVVSPSPSLGPVPSVVPLDDALLDRVSRESTEDHGGAIPGKMTESPANRVADKSRATDGPSCERRIDAAHRVESPYVPAEPEDGQPIMAQAVLESDRIGDFLPLLRVKHFLWPEACLRMSRQAPTQLDLLTDSLSRQSAEGRKVVGFGGYGAGEGCTTILLSAARSLAGSGIKAIVVDADFGNPCLDERLGIACQIGWGEVLAVGEPLEGAAVESQLDRLVLLPLRSSSDGSNGSDRRGDLGAVLRRLREHYDLVLVDLGKLNADTLTDDRLGRPVKECIDAVVMVRDVRNGVQPELDQVERLLHQAELVELGVVENFV